MQTVHSSHAEFYMTGSMQIKSQVLLSSKLLTMFCSNMDRESRYLSLEGIRTGAFHLKLVPCPATGTVLILIKKKFSLSVITVKFIIIILGCIIF